MAEQGPTICVLLRRREERRQAERFAAAMPMRVDGVEGTTQDLSSTGLSFRADHPHEPGARVEVVIEYLLDGHSYPLRCEAEVVRCVPDGDGHVVGARLLPQLPALAPGEEDRSRRPRLRSVD